MPAMAQAPTNFREATRLNKIQLPAKTWPEASSSALGQRQVWDMPQTGFGARLIMRVVATVTLGAGTPALADRGPWSLINRWRFYSNQGGDIDSMSGWGAYQSMLTRRFYRFIDAVMTSRTYATNIYSAPITAASANAWVLLWELPFAINERDDTGVLLFQNEEATFTLEGAIAGAGTDVLTSAVTTAVAAVTGTPVLEYYTVPQDEALWPTDLRLIYQLMEERQNILAVGDTPYVIPRGSVLRKLIATISLNAVRNSTIADITQFNLLYNANEVPYRNIPSWYVQYLQRVQYGNDLPLGLWGMDWTDSNGWIGLGDFRDLIATSAVSDLQWIFTVGSGATLGANNNYADVLRDLLSLLS